MRSQNLVKKPIATGYLVHRSAYHPPKSLRCHLCGRKQQEGIAGPETKESQTLGHLAGWKCDCQCSCTIPKLLAFQISWPVNATIVRLPGRNGSYRLHLRQHASKLN